MVAVASVAAAATTTTTTTTTSSSYGCYNNITPPRWKSGNGNYCSSSPISVVSMTKTPKLLLHASSSSFNNPLLLCRYGALPSTFVGFKHLGISVQFRSGRGAACRGVRCKRGRTIQASLFGVGAPEALVIGVVALLVFGPKGLAEVARNLGKTLRAFQPTIRELQEVSRDFKSTLEREIGLDEVQSSLQSTYRPPNTSVNEKPLSAIDQNGAQPYKAPYSSEDLLKVTEQQLATSSATQAQGTNSEEKPQAVETTATENSASNAVPESSQTSSIPPSLEAVPPAAAPATDSLTSTTQSPSSVEKSQNEQ